MIKERINVEKPIKLVMDCGNASGAINGPEIFKELGIELRNLL